MGKLGSSEIRQNLFECTKYLSIEPNQIFKKKMFKSTYLTPLNTKASLIRVGTKKKGDIRMFLRDYAPGRLEN